MSVRIQERQALLIVTNVKQMTPLPAFKSPTATRSKIMSAIKSSGNHSTEIKMVKLLRRERVSGWRRHANLAGKPDFVFHSEGVVVFVDGCFWHGCPHCFKSPKINFDYWSQKIQRNVERDKKVSRRLRMLGWSVLRIRECLLKKFPDSVVRKIRKALRSKSSSTSRNLLESN